MPALKRELQIRERRHNRMRVAAAIGCWMLDVGCWMLLTGGLGKHPTSNTQHPTSNGGAAAGQESPRSLAHDSAGGFTLIELMVVVVLIGVMAAMIIPEMKGTFEDALLRSTSRELINVFSIAGSRAVSVNQVLQVRLDRQTGQYAVLKRVREGGRESRFVPALDVPGGQGKLDTRISIQIHVPGEENTQAAAETPPAVIEGAPQGPDSENAIAFYPDGTADAREIVLRDNEGFRLGLRINPVTARVHIVELARE
jgi:prepilin-type N-terminal cleavage/methylation domain-containing protein